MINIQHSLILIATIAIVTAIIRFLPFVVFRKGTPEPILYLGKVLPYSVMAMLVVYCLKDINFISVPNWIPQVIAIVVIYIVHKIKHNTLISIITGTITYMLLIQFVF